jgi:hypothetical protein
MNANQPSADKGLFGATARPPVSEIKEEPVNAHRASLTPSIDEMLADIKSAVKAGIAG